MAKKIEIRSVINNSYSPDVLVGDIRDAIDKLSMIQNLAMKSGFLRVVIEDDTGMDSPTDWIIVGYRLETDDEQEKRLEKKAKQAEKDKVTKRDQKAKAVGQIEKLAMKHGIKVDIEIDLGDIV